MTLFPGKQGESNFGDSWDRGLELDMRVIADWARRPWSPSMEGHRGPMLNVPGLGDTVEQAGFEWHHLPIPDVDVPDDR